HADEFLKLLRIGNETDCIKYINKYNDFYDIPITLNRSNSLICAIAFQYENIVTELIRMGANVNYKSVGNKTVLTLSCIYRRENIIIILIEAGALFVEFIDSHIVKYSCYQVIQYIRNVYRKQIISVIDDGSTNNAMAVSFKTTYVSGIIDIISEFII
ncbi:MAG: hypothetical protein Faunusvirus35_12, partial [Faunusvirus sp.]